MAAGKDPQWTGIYETPSPSDADLVRTTLEVAGYRVWVQGGNAPRIFGSSTDTSGALTVSVPAEDADEARDYLKQKTGFLPHDGASAPSDEETAPPPESLADKYCGSATLDVGEIELDSRMIALLRASGLGVNSATFSEFEPGERICTDCAGHEVACELCGRLLDAFLDQGEYRQAKDDEAYVCSVCRGRLEDQLQPDQDW